MASVSRDDSRFQRLIRTVERGARYQDEISKEDLANAVTELSQYAGIHGVPHDSLDVLAGILTSQSNLNQGAISMILKNLYPRTKVSEEIAVKIVGCFGEGQGKPSLHAQALLLRWLAMVYTVLERCTLLSQLYAVLFNMLDMITLRPNICYLLCKLTRRKHVKPFRIQALLELRHRVGSEQPLLSLLQAYKDYYPDVIVVELGLTRQFSHLSPDWMQRLRTIQEANNNNVNNTLKPSDQTSFQVTWKRGTKRRKIGHLAVPEVRTFKAVETSITLEEVENANDFVWKLEKLELPNQLAAVLEDQLLPKMLSLKPSTTTQKRINNWIAVYLGEQLSSPTSGNCEKILEKIVNYTKYTKVLLPATEEYLQACLKKEKKVLSKNELELLSFLSPRSFGNLLERFFKPLNEAYKWKGPAKQAELIHFHSALLRYWILVSKSRRLQSTLSVELEETSLTQYMRYVGNVCTEMLQKNTQPIQVIDATLSFFELAAIVPLENMVWRLVLPPESLVHLALFYGNAMALSRMCGILSSYKRAFQHSDLELKNVAYPQSYINHFNGFVMDACNIIWRNRALVAGDQNALAARLSPQILDLLRKCADVRNENIQMIFSLSHSAVLSQMTAISFKELEERAQVELRHLGPVTQKSLNALANDGGLRITFMEYRVKMLDELEKRGLSGVKQLMYNTMTSLTQGGTSEGGK